MRRYRRYYRKHRKEQSIASIILVLGFMIWYGVTNQDELSHYFRLFIAIILLLVAVVTTVFVIIELKKRKYYLTCNINQIDMMSGEEFEKLLQVHFEKQGYKVSLTPKTNDYGADLILYRDGVKTVVQAKRHRSKIGNSAVQEIVAARNYYRTSHCMVITNSYFTNNARQLAVANMVELWDRNCLTGNFHIL